MDFINALLDALIPSRVARAEAESFHLGLLWFASRDPAEAPSPEQQLYLSGH